MSLTAYPSYQDSGSDWLGEIPEHWAVASLRYYATFFTGSTPSRDNPDYWNGDVPWVKTGEINYRDILFTEETITQEGLDASSCSVAPAGTMLMALYGQGVTRGRVALLGIPAAFNQACVAITTDERLCAQFLQCFFQFAYSHVRDHGNETTQMNLNVDFVRQIRVVVPPLDEQEAIASFLDVETAKIDDLVSEQRRLIELLKEKRQAVISHAVTKGLNPNAPMKPSGIQWLGDVPEHWEVKTLRRVGHLQNGLSIAGDAFGSGHPFISYGDVYNNPHVPQSPSGLVESSVEDQEKCNLEVGDVLFTRTSETVDDIGVASTCLNTIPHSTFAGFLIRFRPNDATFDALYSTHLFRNEGVRRHFAGTMNIVTRASLTQDMLKELPVCIPPLAEQHSIGKFIDRQLGIFDALVSEAEQAINLLQERRTALISAAVTGKIDVRNYASQEAV